jgi:hypothetical protein
MRAGKGRRVSSFAEPVSRLYAELALWREHGILHIDIMAGVFLSISYAHPVLFIWYIPRRSGLKARYVEGTKIRAKKVTPK